MMTSITFILGVLLLLLESGAVGSACKCLDLPRHRLCSQLLRRPPKPSKNQIKISRRVCLPVDNFLEKILHEVRDRGAIK
jgi:hypothetical protein